MHDPISDLLTRIRNAGQAQHVEVTIPHSRLKEAVVRLLKDEGYLNDVRVEGDKIKSLKVGLRYQGRRSVITGLRQISTPGLRRYVGAGSVPRVLGGLGVAVLSTPKGVLSGLEAQKQNVGGELICYVW
ncbi:MAG TPA: 30S ribosomal protein S8 [Verrucomicrobiales bacterium]|nr:30S ribosomal protein S8 [Verrucomicrobiales bacterium]